jgi:D-alanine-D-alanine ligase
VQRLFQDAVMPAPESAPRLRLAIVHEPEAAAAARLQHLGFPAETASEIAVYLAQSTDLGACLDEIASDAGLEGVEVEAVPLDAALQRLQAWRDDGPTVVWPMTDGFAYYRGSGVAALARLAGLPLMGSPAQAQHLCQDKFKCGMLARAAGRPTPPTALYDGRRFVAGDDLAGAGPLFVKPNRLGAKLGIFADSKAPDLPAALELAERIAHRYKDRAVVQAFLPGDDVRVSALDLGGPLREALGFSRILRDPRSETGGEFLTMLDNASLSGSRDTQGGLSGFGQSQQVAFTPRLVDLRQEAGSGDEKAGRLIDEISGMVERAVDLFGLRDLFSFDIRVPEDGRPVFLEFEVCPAVTIYDFQSYLDAVHRVPLGRALARLAGKAAARPELD